MTVKSLQIPPVHNSPRAFARYRDLVEEANREPVVLEYGFDLTEAQSTWDTLTACEAAVFGIEPRLHHALIYAHRRYEDMTGIMDAEFTDFRDEERAAYPQWFKGERVYLMDDAIAFMVLACGLPASQAIAWVCLAKIQQVRTGLINDD